MPKDFSSILPEGNRFEFWERDCEYSPDKLDTSKLSLFGDFFDNINFDNLNNSLNNLKETLGRITGKELKWLNWLYYNLLRPLGEWTLNDAVPAFIDLLNASLKFST